MQPEPLVPLYIVEGVPGPARARAAREILDAHPDMRPAALLLEQGLAGNPEIAPFSDVTVHVSAFGCPCCAGALPLVVTLGRILRHERPKVLVIGIVSGAHRQSLAKLIEEKFGNHLELGVFCHKSADVAQGLLCHH